MIYNKKLSKADQHQLDAFYHYLISAKEQTSGYPCNHDFDYSELYRFLEFHLNNIGDPQAHSNYKLNSHQFEIEVLDFFAELTHIKSNYKGYITHGGTEGNFFGLNTASQRFSDGVFYFSKRTHYCIEKICRLMHVPYVEVPALDNGEIDYDALTFEMKKNNRRPAIINVNIGTTMTGAIDNIPKIQEAIKKAGVKQAHLHADAALSGLILPFIDNPPPFHFADGIDSIAISGHKFIGSPIPCGIALTKASYIAPNIPPIAYTRTTDITITSSRNGITPLFLWYAIQRQGTSGFKDVVQDCLGKTEFTIQQMQKNGIAAWANPYSITVVFPKPTERLIEKWQLAPYKDIAHIICMPSISIALIKALVAELAG